MVAPTTQVCLLSRLVSPGLGDLVQRNIFLRLIHRAHPDATLTWVVPECVMNAAYQRDAVLHHSYADQVLVCPDVDGRSDSATAGRFVHQLARQRFQVSVVDPSSRGLGPREARQAGIPARIAIPTARADDRFITHPMRLPPPVLGMPDLYDYTVALARALEVAPPRPADTVPRLPTGPDEPPPWSIGGPLIGIHPGGARAWHRRWPLDHYAQLCVRLASATDATLVIVGSPDEQAEATVLRRTVLAHSQRASIIDSLGAPLNQLASLIGRMILLIGNDSAPAHLAAALATPTVVVYGPTATEPLWSRIYPRHRGVNRRYRCQQRRHEPGTVPPECEHRCPHRYASHEHPYPRCLSDISVDEVWQAVQIQLAAGSAAA